MLETAILNLAINARDAMKPKGGNLIIETANRHLDQAYCNEHEDVTIGDYVEIAVTDTGAGIAPENIEKVFQPFFTTKGPRSGFRPRPFHDLWFREAVRRPHQNLLGSGSRNSGQNLSPLFQANCGGWHSY